MKFAQAVDGADAVLRLHVELKTVADSQERSKGKNLKRHLLFSAVKAKRDKAHRLIYPYYYTTASRETSIGKTRLKGASFCLQ